MKGLTFKLEHEEASQLGFAEIEVVDKFIFRTREFKRDDETIIVYEYHLDCIADGEFHTIEQDTLVNEIAEDIYKLMH